jgi:hypothetical protein
VSQTLQKTGEKKVSLGAFRNLCMRMDEANTQDFFGNLKLMLFWVQLFIITDFFIFHTKQNTPNMSRI